MERNKKQKTEIAYIYPPLTGRTKYKNHAKKFKKHLNKHFWDENLYIDPNYL